VIAVVKRQLKYWKLVGKMICSVINILRAEYLSTNKNKGAWGLNPNYCNSVITEYPTSSAGSIRIAKH